MGLSENEGLAWFSKFDLPNDHQKSKSSSKGENDEKPLSLRAPDLQARVLLATGTPVSPQQAFH